MEFATVKATRGLNVTDDYLTADLQGARAAGLAVAPYHFYTGTSADTGGAQADRFIAAVRATGYTGQRAGDLPRSSTWSGWTTAAAVVPPSGPWTTPRSGSTGWRRLSAALR
ncbi:GH25 family lysozyme [Streptomyces scabiei]|uniref:GH25 family lysozyme n=1 Tax=Streptomyces scabiei TaxID=1930 RepID=UPI0027DECEA1|nr:GH25 family lysozyme [Streptomyces sp. LBUM 1488]